MASISNEPNGRRTVQFVDTDGRRRSVRLGKVSKRQAETVRARIEELIASRATGQGYPPELTAWLDEAGDQLHERLTAAGLVKARQRQGLADFIDGYIARRTDTKPSTRTVYTRARRHLVAHFGEGRPLRSITAADADGFRIALVERGLSEATARRTIGIAKQFFRAAARAGVIAENPFADLVAAVPANPERAYFVTREETARVMDAATDDEWRLLIALARFGALRTPSEPLLLTWGDIDFENSRILVRSPKTEHHKGKGTRVMPLFPELRPFLEIRADMFDSPNDPVILHYRESTVNLRTRLLKNIRRAGLTPWPKLWQNMRASRETELVETFPSHVVAQWVGHSVAVAEKHYLQVTEDHFAKAVQNPVQHMHAGGGIAEKPESGDARNPLLFNTMQKGSR
jgi:integrase